LGLAAKIQYYARNCTEHEKKGCARSGFLFAACFQTTPLSIHQEYG